MKKTLALLFLTITLIGCSQEDNKGNFKITEPFIVSKNSASPITESHLPIHENDYLQFKNINSDIDLFINSLCFDGLLNKYKQKINTKMRSKILFISLIPEKALSSVNIDTKNFKCSFFFKAKAKSGSTHSFSLIDKPISFADNTERRLAVKSNSLQKLLFAKTESLLLNSEQKVSRYKIECNGKIVFEKINPNEVLPLGNISFIDASNDYKCVALGFNKEVLASRSHLFFITNKLPQINKKLYETNAYSFITKENRKPFRHKITKNYLLEETVIKNITGKNQYFIMSDNNEAVFKIFTQRRSINHKAKLLIDTSDNVSINSLSGNKKLITILPGGTINFNYYWPTQYESIKANDLHTKIYQNIDSFCHYKDFNCNNKFLIMPVNDIHIYQVKPRSSLSYEPVSKLQLFNSCFRTANAKHNFLQEVDGLQPCHQDIKWKHNDLKNIYKTWALDGKIL